MTDKEMIKKALTAIAITVAFVGAWLWFTPFFGPPGTLDSNRTVAMMRSGDRGLCRPAFIGLFASVSDDARLIECQKTGVSRLESGLLLLVAAGVLALVTEKTLGVPLKGEESNDS